MNVIPHVLDKELEQVDEDDDVTLILMMRMTRLTQSVEAEVEAVFQVQADAVVQMQAGVGVESQGPAIKASRKILLPLPRQVLPILIPR